MINGQHTCWSGRIRHGLLRRTILWHRIDRQWYESPWRAISFTIVRPREYTEGLPNVSLSDKRLLWRCRWNSRACVCVFVRPLSLPGDRGSDSEVKRRWQVRRSVRQRENENRHTRCPRRGWTLAATWFTDPPRVAANAIGSLHRILTTAITTRRESERARERDRCRGNAGGTELVFRRSAESRCAGRSSEPPDTARSCVYVQTRS